MSPKSPSKCCLSPTPTLVCKPRKHYQTLRKLYTDKKAKSHLDRIALTDGSITRIAVDAIVNPARRDLLLDSKGTVSYEIHEAAGAMLVDECKQLNGCGVGEAKITDSCKLRDCKYIIHTVGPIYSHSHQAERAKSLTECYTNSLKLAASKKIKKIAFPLISVDQNGFPLHEAVQIAFRAVRNFLATPEGDKIEVVVFVARGEDQMNTFLRLVPHYFPDAA